jgi:hypothetical protein
VRRIQTIILGLAAGTSSTFADSFTWTVDPNTSILTTTISATLGTTISDSESNKVSGFLGGDLALPAYAFRSIHLTTADLSYTTNPSFSLTQPFVGGVNIVGNGLGFSIPGPNNLGFPSPAPTSVGLDGSFSQSENGAEGRGTLTYTGVGLLGSSIGTGTISLVDQSPLPMDWNGTISQTGNKLLITLPISVDQTTVQNGIPVRVQITGSVFASATTTANGWKADVDGDWGTQSNWIAGGGVPGAAGQNTFDTAVFGNFGANSQRTISIGSAVAPRRILVDAGTTGLYRFEGAQTISLSANANGAAGMSVLSGEARFNAPVTLPAASTANVASSASLVLSNATAASTTTLTKSGAGTLRFHTADVGVVDVAGGVAAFAGAGPTARVSSLNIGAAGSAAVSDTLVIESQSGGVAQLSAYLARSLASGAPGGILQPATGRLGIGTKASTGLASVGAFPLTSSSLLLRATIAGDANLDRVVNFDDLLLLAQSYGGAGYWFQGDFNYDGQVSFDDLLDLARQYGTSASLELPAGLSPTLAQDFALARSLVPEPMIAVTLPVLLHRRRRNGN